MTFSQDVPGSAGTSPAHSYLPSPQSLDISAPNTPQSAFSDLTIQPIANESSPSFLPACALEANLNYQEQLTEALNRIEMNLIENRYRQQDLIERLLKLEIEDDESFKRKTACPAFLVQPPFFKSKKCPEGPPPNDDAVQIAHHRHQRPQPYQITRLTWTIQDDKILTNAVRQESLHLHVKPLMQRLDHLEEMLKRVDKYDIEARRDIMGEIVRKQEELDNIKESPPCDEILLGVRCRTDINWITVSSMFFEGLRAPEDCRLRWDNYLHPSVNRSNWTSTEADKLFQAIRKHTKPARYDRKVSVINWVRVAETHGNRRTAFSCFTAYLHKLTLPRPWSTDEDRALRSIVSMCRFGNKIAWSRVSYLMADRGADDCRHRFLKTVGPTRNVGRWSPEEDRLLLRAVEEHGEGKWSRICQEVPSRTQFQCRERYLFRLSGHFQNEPWNKASDQILIDLMMEHGPTVDCAIIAEGTLKKPRKEIYKRFNHLICKNSRGRTILYKRKSMLTNRASELREREFLERVSNSNLNSSADDLDSRVSKVVKQSHICATKRGDPSVKLIDKLRILKPSELDPHYLRSELKRTLPSYRSLKMVPGDTNERISNALDEKIMRNALKRQHLERNRVMDLLPQKVLSEDTELSILIAQIMATLRIDHAGALEMLKLRATPGFKDFEFARERAKSPKSHFHNFSFSTFLRDVKKLQANGIDVVEPMAVKHLKKLNALRSESCVVDTVREYRSLFHSTDPTALTMWSYPTSLVLPLPPRAEETDSEGELLLSDGDQGDDDDDGRSPDVTLGSSLLSMYNEPAASVPPVDTARTEDVEIGNSSSSPKLSSIINKDLSVKVLLELHRPKNVKPKTEDEVIREAFLRDYGTVLTQYPLPRGVHAFLEHTKGTTSVIHKDLILSLVNIETDRGLRTLCLPLARLPFQVNDGSSFHLIPEPGEVQCHVISEFSQLCSSNISVSELLQTARADKTYSSAKALLSTSIGRVFMSRDDRENFQQFLSQIPLPKLPREVEVPLLPPNASTLSLTDRLFKERLNLLCRGLFCYRAVRGKTKYLARTIFKNRTDVFKFKTAEIAYHLSLYNTIRSRSSRSTLHAHLYAPLKDVPEYDEMEHLVNLAYRHDTEKQQRVQQRLMAREEELDSCLDIIRRTDAFHILRYRVISIFLWPLALSQLNPAVLAESPGKRKRLLFPEMPKKTRIGQRFMYNQRFYKCGKSLDPTTLNRIRLSIVNAPLPPDSRRRPAKRSQSGVSIAGSASNDDSGYAADQLAENNNGPPGKSSRVSLTHQSVQSLDA